MTTLLQIGYCVTLLSLLWCARIIYEVKKDNTGLYSDLARAQETIQKLDTKLENMEKPPLKSTWQHTNGAVYEVIGYANIKSTNLNKYPVTIIYRNMKGDVWCRPANDWHRSFTLYSP